MAQVPLPQAKFCPAGYAVPLGEVAAYGDARVAAERARLAGLAEQIRAHANAYAEVVRDGPVAASLRRIADEIEGS